MLTALFAIWALGAASFAPIRMHALALLIAPDRPREIETPPAPTAAVPDIPAERSAIVHDDARPTLARPAPGATGLFQGWGPRIG
ncbi:MAG: hypothetical protein JWN27_4229 [Candidatus Eremiobacteraeota bacterium]|nr:hypothetical protein [Candidatus Eremiobacteraeota bacterium]